MGVNTCVCCGAEIPEGRQFCPMCDFIYSDEELTKLEFDPINIRVRRDITITTTLIKE